MTDEAILAQAIDWHIRLREERPEDWEAFALWLEGDPRHAQAYDSLLLADADLGAALAAQPPAAANDDISEAAPMAARRRWAAGAGAIAAALVAAVLLRPAAPAASDYAVTTGPGERKMIAIGGNEIALNGATRLVLRHGDGRFARLDGGEARFSIRHDAANPFMIEVGQDRIQDVGTVFNVARDEAGLRIAVAEGAILYNPDREAVAVGAGHLLRVPAQGDRILLAALAPAEVAGWHNGRLAYHDAPLTELAADLGRALGTKVRLADGVAQRHFTGVIRIGHDRTALFHRLGILLDLDARQDANGWILAPHGAGR